MVGWVDGYRWKFNVWWGLWIKTWYVIKLRLFKEKKKNFTCLKRSHLSHLSQKYKKYKYIDNLIK